MEQKDKGFSKFRHEIVNGGLLAQLSNRAIRVYLVILRHANYETGLSYPTVKTISKESGVNKNLISSATRELVLNGLIDKSRAPKRFAFRNCYRIVKHLRIRLGIIPRNTDKCRRYFHGKNGKFKPVPENAENGIPQNTDNAIPRKTESDAFPKTTEKKKNLEIENRDKDLERAGEASACSKSQASPALNSKKSLKTISKEELHQLIEEVGPERVRGYFRKKGYSEEEIEELVETKGSESERVNTAKSD